MTTLKTAKAAMSSIGISLTKTDGEYTPDVVTNRASTMSRPSVVIRDVHPQGRILGEHKRCDVDIPASRSRALQARIIRAYCEDCGQIRVVSRHHRTTHQAVGE